MKEDDEKVSFSIIEELIQDEKNPETNKFIEKLTIYLHFITKMQTKKIMAESITKQNFISFIPQILTDSRTLSSLRLQRNGGFIEIMDTSVDKSFNEEENFNILLKKWKLIGSIVSEILCQETDAFWAKTFH